MTSPGATAVTRLLLCEKVRELRLDHSELKDKLIDFYYELGGQADYVIVRNTMSHFISQLSSKVKNHSYKYSKVFEKERNWLSKPFIAETVPGSSLKAGPGRKRKDYKECCPRVKKRKVNDLSYQNCTEALALATESRAKSSPGQKDLGYIVKQANKNTSYIKEKIENKAHGKMSPETALALKVNTNMSDACYQQVKNASKTVCHDIYPSIHEIRKVKLKCYPEGLNISEISASSNLQNLLDHTLSRILELTDLDLFFQNSTSDVGIFQLKAGFDGASSQSIYCQKYELENYEEAMKNEETLLQTGIVPLSISFGDRKLWEIENPNSAKFCRPLKLEFIKETKDVCVNEQKVINDQISKLNPFIFDHNGSKFTINYNIELTMLDNKAINALTNTNSTQTCNACGARPSEMNNIALIRDKPVDKEALKLGLSTLHCWIRTFEYVLHISYKIENKKFLADDKKLKDSVKARKSLVGKQCRSELDLVVDMPKHGFGNSNTGNTARRAFANSSKFSEITMIDEDVIIRLRVILKAISCGTKLNIPKFREYCKKTTELLIEKYGWYTMPPSVHKILEHGHSIAELFELPLGFYSEENLEAQHKDVRNARLNHTCKINRINTMTNLYHYLLIKTDPVIASTKFTNSKKSSDDIEFEDDDDLRPLLKFD